MRQKTNLIGQNVTKFRYERGWTQDELVGKIQLAGCDMTRDTLANIETQRRGASDTQTAYIAKALGVDVAELFPPEWRSGKTKESESDKKTRKARPSRSSDR